MTSEPGSAAMERTDFVKRLRAARANGDPEKYIAMITVWEAHAIADRIETLTRERDEAREALKKISKQPYYSLPVSCTAAGSLLSRYHRVMSIADKALSATPAVLMEEKTDVADKASAWDQCVKSSARARNKALEEAAHILETYPLAEVPPQNMSWFGEIVDSIRALKSEEPTT